MKPLREVQYALNLAHNHLSVGQLLLCGYVVSFDDSKYYIIDKKSSLEMARVCMTPNKMFPLAVSNVRSLNLVTRSQEDSDLWHNRYGHLNIKGLKHLYQKMIVHRLPSIDCIETCESCIYRKKFRSLFPSGQAWRKSTKLELVHVDLCGPMQTGSLGGNLYFRFF